MSTSVNILIADDVHPVLMDGLKAVGVKYTYAPDITQQRVNDLLAIHNVLVLRSKFCVDEDFLKAHPNLSLIIRAGAGMDTIDIETATKLGITCLNAPEGNRDAVAEHTLAMVLALLTNLKKGQNEIQNGLWDREGNRGLELGCRTVGIIGYGNTGSSVAARLKGFGCRVLAYDKYKSGYGDDQVQESSYEQLLAESDIITFHIPLTSETQGWINSGFIKRVQNPFVLLNMSRGEIMETQDVIEGIKANKITHFATDVLENEKIESWNSEEKKMIAELSSNPKVILTPHVGGWTHESYKRISEVIFQKICNHFNIELSQNDQFKRERLYVG